MYVLADEHILCAYQLSLYSHAVTMQCLVANILNAFLEFAQLYITFTLFWLLQVFTPVLTPLE